MKNVLKKAALFAVTVVLFVTSTASAESKVVHEHFSPAFADFAFNMHENDYVPLGYWTFTWKCRNCGYRVTLEQGVRPDWSGCLKSDTGHRFDMVGRKYNN